MSAESESTTPAKYRPDERQWEDKAWLYEQYWGEMKSCSEIAAGRDVSPRHIQTTMNELGIPRRHDSWKREAGEYDIKDAYDIEEQSGPDWSVYNE